MNRPPTAKPRAPPVDSPLVGEEITPTYSTSSAIPIDEPPDGGFLAWSQIVPGHIANMLSWGYGTGFSVFQLYYKQTMHLPASQVAWVGSIQIFLCFVIGMVSGRLSDAGYPKLLYATGAIVTVFGMFMTSLATTYWQVLLAQGFLTGIGGGLMFMPATANVATYFKKNRSLAVALNGCGSSTGAILFPALVQFLTPKLGFGWAVRICGFIGLFLAVIGFFVLKPRKLRRIPAPVVDWNAFKNIPYSTFCAGAFLIYFSLFTMLLYINSFARESIGLSNQESINFVLVTNAVAMPARPIFGVIADRYAGPVNTFGINCIALGIMAFGWIGVHTRSDMYAYSVVMGFVNGGAQGIFSSAVSSFVKDVTKMGTWIGMAFALCGFATLAGPPTMGAIIDASGGRYIWGQLWAGLTIVIGGIFILASSRLVVKDRGGNIWTKV
ncbi:MFS general substrate transporter [Annulohypoxylon maeteangense]|uniref:MFS general substrate transporter n=1 Tax=Annulohypoxylon maeteangense TaxID=1927788 RepID=UPI002007865B|nr:MFS general substrate transporter [Annulohypoxylon maeteangense]KAI0887365.1 MFS general substrate transporter [Annulohypoxylon maeteangense]